MQEVLSRWVDRKLQASDRILLANALADLRSATNWLEGSERFEEAHRALDRGGRVRRILFRNDCALAFENGSYHQRCPVALGHNRLGVSIGGVIEESECSICGDDPEDCSHITGRAYEGQECVRVIKRFSLDHMAFVANPDFPDARIMSAPMDTADIQAVLGDAFESGMDVSCDRCLSKCPGMRWPMRRGLQSIALN